LGIGDWGLGVWGFGVGGRPQTPHTPTQKPNHPKKKKKIIY